MKNVLSWILRLALAGGGLLYATWGIDFSTLWQALGQYDPWSLLLTQAYLFLLFLPPTFRIVFLSQGRAGTGTALKSVVLCLGLNNILPAKLGELAKVFYLRKTCGIPTGQGLGIVFWERFSDLNAVLLIGAVAALCLNQDLILLPLLVVVGGIWAFLAVFWLCPELVRKMVHWLPSDRLRKVGLDALDNLRAGMNLRFFAALSGLTVLAWISYSSFVLLFLWLVGKFSLTFLQCIVVFVISTLGMSLPSTPGALGVYEAAIVLSLGWFGVGKEQALAAALTLHMIQYLPTTAGGLLLMARSGIGLSELRMSANREM